MDILAILAGLATGMVLGLFGRLVESAIPMARDQGFFQSDRPGCDAQTASRGLVEDWRFALVRIAAEADPTPLGGTISSGISPIQ